MGVLRLINIGFDEGRAWRLFGSIEVSLGVRQGLQHHLQQLCPFGVAVETQIRFSSLVEDLQQVFYALGATDRSQQKHRELHEACKSKAFHRWHREFDILF